MSDANHVKEALQAALAGGELSAALLEKAFGAIMDGAATAAQMAGLLVALRAKGETPLELAAIARVLRARAAQPERLRPDALDTCGTGGDGAGTFNISTAAALVAAGAGVPVAKHGNRAASSQTGSADVLEALGVTITLDVPTAARVLDDVGIAFFFARSAHPAMRHLAPVRAELGVRTLMNCMGPLLNPVGARRQLVGVYDRALLEPLCEVLAELGSEAALLVHGADGLDEITTTGPTHAMRLHQGRKEAITLHPEALGIAQAEPAALAGGDAAVNAAMIREVLAGAAGAPADIVLLNAAAALWTAGAAASMEEGLAQARRSIESGAAAQKLEALARATQHYAQQAPGAGEAS